MTRDRPHAHRTCASRTRTSRTHIDRPLLPSNRLPNHRHHPRRPSPLRSLAPAPLLLAAALAFPGCSPADTPPQPESLAERFASAQLIELTHPLGEETLVWPTSDPFTFEVTAEGYVEAGYYYASRNFAGTEHGGTHLDAPVHFYEGRWTTDQLPLERLMGPGAVVDVSAQAAADPDYQVQVEDLTAWEAEHGQIPDGAILLLFTDRSRLWPDAEAYMGTAERGADAVASLSFPGLHPEAARWLVENRNVAGVGLDTPSLDFGGSTLFEAHRILSEANVFGLENVANLERLPPTGALILALPAFFEGGTGGPVRIVGVVE